MPNKDILSPFQNVDRFDFSRFIYFAMYQIYVISKCIANTMNLEKSKRHTFWNGWSTKKKSAESISTHLVEEIN